MLHDILTVIKNGEVSTPERLGQKLNLSSAMVDMSLNQLMQMGYLEKESVQSQNNTCQNVPKACQGCSQRCSSFQQPIYLYSLTDRAKRSLQF